jgi:hypothetical protein
MLDFIPPGIIAALQLLTAAGIIHFWFNWFRTEHNEPWLPQGYIIHERCFVYPDTVMSVLLVCAAVLLFAKHPLGERLSLVCGGMMLFLAILDTVYFIQNNMLEKDTGRAENLGVIVPLLILGPLMILRFI